MNPRKENEANEVPDPHPCSLNTNKISDDAFDKDYEDLINCCQRHVCRPNGGYCSSKKGCRFGFPFDLLEKSRIVFNETKYSVKCEINLMRNDPNTNIHNRLICHHWRGNVDMSIILDRHRAISYMVKYATKGEKKGQMLSQLFKDVIKHTTEDDDPKTKIRSLMIKHIAGDRDIGQCEVSRLLMSQPLFHSSFDYVTLNTNINTREINTEPELPADNSAFKKSLIDYYANRKKLGICQPYLSKIRNLIDFAKLFNTNGRNELIIRPAQKQTVIVTYPKIRWDPDNNENNKNYCLHNLIKYSDWDIDNIEEIQDLDTALQRWQTFLSIAPPDIIEIINFHTDLSKQLKVARSEGREEFIAPTYLRDNWQILSEIRPQENEIENDVDEIVADKNYDFLSHRNKYTKQQLEKIENQFIKVQKELTGDENENEIPAVEREQLNKMQKFAFDLVNEKQRLKEQLLMIINGSAGTGKSFTIFSLSHMLKHKLKRSAPTAKAAFIIKGQTIHSRYCYTIF